MNSQGPVCILIAALGGQGGGVLADWLVTAARLAGLESQATSIPGVAQRTGATTYYFEVWREPDLPSRPVFSIFPASGAIDLVVSFEPMEAARALSGGYIGAETTVISARERIFSTFEKIRPGDGVTPLAPVFDALEKMASSLRIIDMTDAARSAKCHPNAVMFGAMAASGILPMPPDVCREAIRKGGVAVDANLSGFEAGMKLLNSPARTNGRPEARLRPCPDAFSPAIAALPEAVQAMAGHGAARLLDYQDRAYVQLYLDRLTRIVLLDKRENGWRLSQKVARALAAWMAFEDVIEVARLKTRPGRFARIRAELGIGDDEPLIVHDYLKPGREELRGLLPGFLSKWIPESQDSNSHGGFSLRLNSAGPAGFAMLRLLGALAPWRRHTSRFASEQKMIERWLDAVAAGAAKDYELACNMAGLAVWARGYGSVRKTGFDQLEKLLNNSSQQIENDTKNYNKAVSASLERANNNPEEEVTP